MSKTPKMVSVIAVSNECIRPNI